MAPTYLFAYADLKAAYNPADTMGTHFVDLIHGDLFDLKRDAAAINIGTSSDVILGETQEIDDGELPSLDAIEAPDYVRVQTTSLRGYQVWVYQYQGELPDGVKKIHEWLHPKDR